MLDCNQHACMHLALKYYYNLHMISYDCHKVDFLLQRDTGLLLADQSMASRSD